VYRGFAKLILQAALAFPLATGMQLPAAGSVPPGHEVGSEVAGRCHDHGGPKTHDCCRSVGCQCHCTSTPTISGVTAVCSVVALAYLLPAADVRVMSTRANEFFKPPIA
jgi:hypothetical protein